MKFFNIGRRRKSCRRFLHEMFSKKNCFPNYSILLLPFRANIDLFFHGYGFWLSRYLQDRFRILIFMQNGPIVQNSRTFDKFTITAFVTHIFARKKFFRYEGIVYAGSGNDAANIARKLQKLFFYDI